MDDFDRESVPVPPKRPTVIRPEFNGPSLPARPAPPVPGGRPPPPIPSRLNDADKPPPAPRRPSPGSVPNRPNNLPPRPTSQSVRPPERPSSDITQRPASQSVKLPEKPYNNPVSTGSVRKRPEITIVCARPMSEVGFRSENSPLSKPLSQTEKSPEVPGKPPPLIAPSVSPTPAQRSPISENNVLIDFSSDTITKTESVQSPQKPSNPRLPPPKPAPVRGAPPVPKRLEADLIDTQDEAKILKPLPSPDKRTGPPPPVRPSISPSENTSEPVNKPPRISPPRLPLEPQISHVPLDLPIVPNRDAVEQQTQNKILIDSQVNSVDDQNTPSHIETYTGDEYAVINKPKRPTIIRPGRPMLPKEVAVSNEDDSKLSGRNPPLPSPRLLRKDECKTETVIGGKDISKSEVENTQDKTPEFLKLKLKSTTEEASTAGVVRPENKGETIKMNKVHPPVLAPKPKPGILPKPQVAAKPKLNKSSVTSQNMDVKDDIVKDHFESSIKHSENNEDKYSGNLHNEPMPAPAVELKHSVVKRPTIIRPAKSQSIEKINSTESQNSYHMKQDATRIDDKRQSFDDSDLRPKPRAQPPVPNKRPVSMINIPKSVEQDTHEMSFSKSMNFASGDSTDKPKPVPRQAARPRPVSVAVPNLGHLQSEAHLEKASQPPRPVQRPPEPDTIKKVPLGVSVLPQLGKLESSHDKVITPAKPARRPPPPRISPKAEEKDSSEDETAISPAGPLKPSRPSVRPPPPKVSPKLESKDTDSSEEEFHSVAQEPPRPPPPSIKRSPDTEKPQRPDAAPPRKISLKEAVDDDEDISPVKARPPKPESRPSRPLSTPVKQNSPPKAKPSRPGSMAVKKSGVPELPGRPGPGHPLYHHMMKVPHGVAQHDYTAQHEDELSFESGDVIILLRSVDDDWIVGQTSKQEGMFPRSFIKVKIPLQGELPDSDSSDGEDTFYDATSTSEKPDLIGHGPRCRARFDFDGEGPEDLQFEDGDVIKLLERLGPEWRKGELNGRVGLFPLSFVDVIEDLPADGATDESSKVVKAMFDYDGLGDELSFQRGDNITVQYKVNDEWLYGECGGRKGQFPVPFVDHMPANLPMLPEEEPNKKDPMANAEALWEEHDRDTQSVQENPSALPKSPVQADTEMPYCVAIYDFSGETPDDLSFVSGDRIELLEHVGADWLKGSLNGRTGMFPSAFVEIHEDLTEPVSMSKKEVHKPIIYGVAQYEFIGEAESELTFEAGARLKLLERVDGVEDWQWGELDGHRGMFPAAFVQLES